MNDRPQAPPSRLALAMIAFAALAGAGAVIMSALAAHALAEPGRGLAETASRFAFVHALAILFTSLWHDRLDAGTWPRRLTVVALALFAAGTILFSGGLLALLAGLYVVGTAPWGGTALIAGWVALAASALFAVSEKG